MTRTLAILTLLLGWATGSVFAQTLKRAVSIDLPGPAGQRFDYLTIDYQDHFLLSAHLGPGILYVLDTRRDRSTAAPQFC